MQVFMSGHYQKWKANSRIAARPQIAKRRSAGPLSASLGEDRRITVPPPTKAAEQAIADMPFPVEAIQVDGSSEFKAEFEQACQARGSACTSCRPTDRRSMAPSSAGMDHALRILRLLRTAPLRRSPHPILKKLAATLQLVQTTRCPCRTNSGQLPQRTLSQRDPAVSYVLISDKGLT